MKNNRILTISLILIIVVLIGGIIFLLTTDRLHAEKEEEQTIDDVLKVSVHINEITTNLLDHKYVRTSLTLQGDGPKAKSEIEKRDFQIRDLLISELSGMKSDDLRGKEGKEIFGKMIKEKINELMQEGTVVDVYVTAYIIS